MFTPSFYACGVTSHVSQCVSAAYCDESSASIFISCYCVCGCQKTADLDSVEAKYDAGLLRVIISKKEDAKDKARDIKVD